MASTVCNEYETPAELRLNWITHAVGVALSVAGIAVLVSMAAIRGQAIHVVTVSIFGASMLLLYLASTVYHACREGRAKRIFCVLDHAGIYALIAGTYTPFLLVMIGGAWGWSLFGVLWGLAVAGVVFQALFVGRFEVVSTIIYLAMGWIGVVAVREFLNHVPMGALGWVLAGGIAYSLGIVFFMWHKLKYHHAIWHTMVMVGTVCHFFAILFHVVP
jgi:hemolysin III